MALVFKCSSRKQVGFKSANNTGNAIFQVRSSFQIPLQVHYYICSNGTGVSPMTTPVTPHIRLGFFQHQGCRRYVDIKLDTFHHNIRRGNIPAVLPDAGRSPVFLQRGRSAGYLVSGSPSGGALTSTMMNKEAHE